MEKFSVSSSCCKFESEIDHVISEHRRSMEILLQNSNDQILFMMNENKRLREKQLDLLNEIKLLRNEMIVNFDIPPFSNTFSNNNNNNNNNNNAKKRTIEESILKWDEIKEVSFEQNKIYKDPEEEDKMGSDSDSESSTLDVKNGNEQSKTNEKCEKNS